MVTKVTGINEVPRAKRTRIAAAIPRAPEQQPVVSPSALDLAYAKMSEGLNETLTAIKAPGLVRTVLSFIAAFCIGAGIGFIVGPLIDLVVLGVLSFTGSIVLALLAWAACVVLAILAVRKIVPFMVMPFATGDADRWFVAKYRNARNRVRGIFETNCTSVEVSHA